MKELGYSILMEGMCTSTEAQKGHPLPSSKYDYFHSIFPSSILFLLPFYSSILFLLPFYSSYFHLACVNAGANCHAAVCYPRPQALPCERTANDL